MELSGKVPFHEWMASLPPGAQAAIDDRLLLIRPLHKWPEKWASDYKGVKGLIELRIKFNKVQYRPFFCYGAGRTLVLLGGGIEKNWKIPKSVIQTMERRIAEYKADHERSREHDFD